MWIDAFINVDPPPKGSEEKNPNDDSEEDLDDSIEDMSEEGKKEGAKEEEKKQPVPQEKVFKIKFFTTFDKDLVLHWGVGRNNAHEWGPPDESIWPANSNPFDNSKSAIQTKFAADKKEEGYRSIYMKIPAEKLKIKGMSFVFFIPEWNQWHNNSGSNYKFDFEEQAVELDSRVMKGESPGMVAMVKEIIACETVYGSWTLMHRYNKCVEMLNKINIQSDADM